MNACALWPCLFFVFLYNASWNKEALEDHANRACNMSPGFKQGTSVSDPGISVFKCCLDTDPYSIYGSGSTSEIKLNKFTVFS